MAGLLGFLAAGAVKGAGDGIVAEAKAKREAAIAALENSRLETRENADRAFRSQEGKLDRDARLGEAATDRDFRASEGEKDRAAQAAAREETMTGENGETLLRNGDRVRPVLDKDGKPVKAMRSDSNQPAEAKMVEYLVTKGIAKDAAEAYKLVTRSKGSEVTQAEIVKMAEDATKTEFDGAIGVSPEKVQAARERNYKRLNDMFAPPKEMSRPEGMTDAQILQEAKQAIAAGGDPVGIRSDLRTLGIDPSKLDAPAAGSTTPKSGRVTTGKADS